MASWTFRPSAAGDLTQFTANPVGSNYARVSDQDDLTLVYSFTDGKTDLYQLPNLSASVVSVSSVIMYIRANCDFQDIPIQPAMKESGATTYSNDILLTESMTTYAVPLFVSGGWTPTKFNGVQVGFRLPTNPGGQQWAGSPYIADVWVVVEGSEAGVDFGTAGMTNADVISSHVQIPPMKSDETAVAQTVTTTAEVPI